MLAADEHGAVRILQAVTQSVPSATGLSLYGIPVIIDETPEVKTANVAANKSTKGCDECGSSGRHRKECSKAGGAAAAKPVTRRRGDPCEECGSLSSRHKLGCSSASGNKAWRDLDAEEKKRSSKMSKRQYDQVKTAHDHGMDPTSIAHEMGLGVKEVNTAILSKSFEQYAD